MEDSSWFKKNVSFNSLMVAPLTLAVTCKKAASPVLESLHSTSKTDPLAKILETFVDSGGAMGLVNLKFLSNVL